MIKKLISRVMLMKAIPVSTIKLIGIILGVFIGGSYMIKGNSFFQSVTNNYNYSDENSKNTTDDTLPINNQTITQKTNTKKTNTPLPKTPQSNSKSKNTISVSPKNLGLFAESSLKNSSKKNISCFITKNGTIDFKTNRLVSSALRGLNINSPSLFNNSHLKYLNDFIDPSMSFLKTHNINNYTDYYFICDISTLDPQKNSGMDTFRSSLNIEGYIINTQSTNVIKFPYNNIKGVGFNVNDATNNMNKDLEDKITTFIKNNI